MPSLTGQFGIPVVLLEKSDGLSVTNTYHDLAFLTILTTGTVGTYEVDVVLGIGDTHTAWLRCHPREGAKGHRGLGLAETLHDVESDFLFEFIEDGRVKGLTGRAAVFQRRKVVFTQILSYHKAVDGRGSAKTRHLVFFHLSQECVSVELLVIEYEHGCTSKPLSIELTPHGLAPASVSHCKME